MSEGVLIAAIGTAGTVVGAVVTALVNRAQGAKSAATETGSRAPEVRRVGRYDGVVFHFLGEEEDIKLTGSVTLRDGEMVLDIPGGWGPYLVIGKPQGHRFQGPSSVRGRSKKVEASWTDLAERYVGWWVEDSWQYLFSFELPNV